MRVSSLELLFTASLIAACATKDSRAPTADASHADARRAVDAECRVFVADALIEHSCFHALSGPFRDLEMEARDARTHLDVSRAHTAFRLRLAADDDGRFRADLRYHARADAGYAMFLSAPSSLSVAPAAGAALAPFLAHDSELCPELPDVLGYDLREGDYELSLSSEHEEVTLVIESMDEGTLEDGYRFECDEYASVEPPTMDLDAGRAEPVEGGDAAEGMEDAPEDREGGEDAGSSERADASEQTDADAQPEPGDGAAACSIDPVLEHSCLHVMHGPFAEVIAAGAGAPPNVNSPHTAYEVALPAGDAGRLGFRPTASAEFVFYLADARALEVTQAGTALEPLRVEPVLGCAGIARAWVFSLTGAVQYQLRLEAATETTTLLVIENVDALAPDGWELRHEEQAGPLCFHG